MNPNNNSCNSFNNDDDESEYKLSEHNVSKNDVIQSNVTSSVSTSSKKRKTDENNTDLRATTKRKKTKRIMYSEEEHGKDTLMTVLPNIDNSKKINLYEYNKIKFVKVTEKQFLFINKPTLKIFGCNCSDPKRWTNKFNKLNHKQKQALPFDTQVVYSPSCDKCRNFKDMYYEKKNKTIKYSEEEHMR